MVLGSSTTKTMKKHSKNSVNKSQENEKRQKKASDSKDKNSESENEIIFTQDDFEDALRRVSRRICEPDEETT